MPEPLGSLVDAVAALIDAFEPSGIAYALGGAVAYSAWAEPRATRDIDLNPVPAHFAVRPDPEGPTLRSTTHPTAAYP